MRAKQWTKRAELKPANVQFRGQFAGWEKPSRVCAPIRNATEPAVDAVLHLGGQSLPTRIRISRPEPSESLQAGISIAVKSKRTTIRMYGERALPIKLVALEARVYRELIAFVRPPAIHSCRLYWKVLLPVCRRVTGRMCYRFRIVQGAVKIPRRHHMQNNIEVLVMQFVEHRFGVRENIGVERERSVPGVPSRWAEACSEINQRVAGQLLFTKAPRHAHDLFPTREGSV
jgi:hypothetical protein